MGGLESGTLPRILGPLDFVRRRSGSEWPSATSPTSRSSASPRVIVQQRSEVPTLAVSVSVPPYAEFGPAVDARRIRSSHLEPGAVFGLRPSDGDASDASFDASFDAPFDAPVNGLDRFAQAIVALRRAHPAVPLVVRIATPLDASAAVLIQHAAQLRVRGVLLDGEPVPDALRRTLTAPIDLAADVVAWLSFRLPRLSPEVAELCRTIFREGPAVARIELLLARVGESARTARARLHKLALPSPAHWHQVARAIHSALCLQRCTATPVFELAMRLGYCDHSALCHQLLRLFGMRASQVRGLLGWEWLLDAWLTRHASAALAAT